LNDRVISATIARFPSCSDAITLYARIKTAGRPASRLHYTPHTGTSTQCSPYPT
jgi:hypothetical protein